MISATAEIAYLGYNASSPYGLSWKVIGSRAPLFDRGSMSSATSSTIRFSHCYFGGYTYARFVMQWSGQSA
jgi:hypothetical protein